MSTFQVYLNSLRQKGYLAYEYNPFHNYQTDVDLYEVSTDVGLVLVPKEQAVNTKNGELLTKKSILENGSIISVWVDKMGNRITNFIVANDNDSSSKLFAKAGSLIDLETDKLNFDLEHPVDIQVQPSYDGSVNLILNDDKNIPRLINSRFSAREKNTYEIVDRIGENDTNIYNSNTFEKDTSLYFQYEYNPVIKYMGYIKGTLPVGQYCFYFTYCDADDNESDYIAESGLIPVFIGSDKDPYSMDGGIKNQLTNKGIKLKLSNMDKSYNYLKVYYVRYFADYQQNRVYECKKLYKRFPINSDTVYLQITGYEEAEDLDPNILNISRFNPKSILAQAQCKNMLFFGNIVKNTDNYRELTDCALRIIPQIYENTNFQTVNNKYESTDANFGYYNASNIYNNVGYFNQEYYRFGVVFIYQNGTLSNVYNTLGYDLLKPSVTNNQENIPQCSKKLFEQENAILRRLYIQVDDEGWVNDNSYTGGTNLNARGVCKFNYGAQNDSTILGIKFNVPEEVINFLKEDLGIRGLFFVRQKCVPNLLAQCYLMPMDDQMEGPVLEIKNDNESEFYTETFVDKHNYVVNDYSSRLYKYGKDSKSISLNAYAAICPDFLLNQPYYNQIFNGSKFRLQQITDSANLAKEERFYREGGIDASINYIEPSSYQQVIINTVTDDVPTVAIQDKIYRLEMGETEEAFRFVYAEVDNGTTEVGEEDYDNVNSAWNIVRGKFSPYLAVYSPTKLDTSQLYNIFQDNVINTIQEYQNRMDSSEPFYAISDRYNFNGLAVKDENTRTLVCWRGDCFINTFTYRLNRNFNDPSLPNNDKIIDKKTWKDNYDASDSTKWEDISRSDLNAVQMGSWITIKVRSAMNYALRSQDHSYVSEEALMGQPRSFYPRNLVMWRGENKMPDSYLYNDAYRASLGYKCYFAMIDVNYIKDTFSNRIQYSAISIQDSFKNNYRYSLSTYFRDYSQEYGSIQKLVGFEGYLLVVFEHAIGIAVVNERVLAGTGDGEPVFINTQNVLPEELTIITDTYGSQWPESVVKSEAGYVYGVDTIAKKIWRVKGQQIEILSDFKVNKFLIDNISLGERELYPIIGLKNVKTHYNNNKKDIMFTFYDDVYKDEEKVWNLCFNELLDKFITFYSWLPSYSENIDTQFFTFDRRTSKWLTLLNTCNYNIPKNTGVLVDIPIFIDVDNQGRAIDNPSLSANLYYRNPDLMGKVYTVQNSDGTTYNKEIPTKEVTIKEKYRDTTIIENKEFLPEYIDFKIEKDHWGNWKHATISKDQETGIHKITFDTKEIFTKSNPVITLIITPTIVNINGITGLGSNLKLPTETVAFTLKSIVNNPALTQDDKLLPSLTTDFYLHGQSGIFNISENIYPTYWYGEFHPFEFEFVVNDKIGQQKIFNDLVIISNKAEPESFHFEIEGDNYEFSEDKRTMYFRQEATKNLYQNLGSDILYNRKYTDVIAIKRSLEQYYRGTGTQGNSGLARQNTYDYDRKLVDKVYPVENTGLVRQVKSTIFPLYYERVDTYNEIYDLYTQMTGTNYDFKNLSGSEIKWNVDLNQFNIVTHIKNSPIDLYGRLRGNSRYKEGKWSIQIPSITFMQKNESENDWVLASKDLKEDGPLHNSGIKIPPIVVNSSNIPTDLPTGDVSQDKLPNIYQNVYNWPSTLDTNKWTSRKEARIRDKWIKVRIRYSGKNLAIIHSIATLYNISYS